VAHLETEPALPVACQMVALTEGNLETEPALPVACQMVALTEGNPTSPTHVPLSALNAPEDVAVSNGVGRTTAGRR